LNKTYTAVAVIGISIAAGAAWWWQNQPTTAQQPQAMTGAAGPGPAGAARPAAGGRPGGPGGPGSTAAVEVAPVEVVNLTDDVFAVGSLKSRQGVMLRPEASGRIARLGFTDGQTVRRGQVLVQLDDSLQQAQLQQAQAQASIARTNLKRSRELLAQNFVSQSAVDQNEASLQVAESQVALAQAQAARMRVLAPFDGTVGIRSVQLGDYVRDGADLVGIEDLSALQIDFTLPERYITRVRVGQPVEMTLDALPDRTFPGRIDALDSQVDPNGRSLRVRASVKDNDAMLRPGMFARSRVVFAVRENAIVVPEEALVPLGTRQLLFKVIDGPDGKKMSQRIEAKIGLRQPGKVEILEGLAPGDQVVTAGHPRLLRADSMPLRIVDLSRAGAPPAASPAPGGAAGPAPGPATPAKPATQP